MKRILTLAVVAAGLAGVPAAAQNAPPPPAVQQPAQDISDAELKSFAVAVIEVSRINDTYLPIYYAAGTPEEQKAVEKKATDEMMQAVRNQGITVDRYQHILNQARSDPQVASRVDQYLQEAASGNSSVGK